MLLWLLCAGTLAFQNRDPNQLHFLSLFFRELPLVIPDIATSFQTLFLSGMRQAAFAVILLLAAAGAGRLLLRTARLPAGAAGCVMRLGAGLAALSCCSLLLGVLQLYSLAGSIIVWALLACCAAYEVREAARVAPGLLKTARVTLPGAAALGFILLSGVFLFSKALRPAVHVDAVTYHLGLPNYFLLEGGIRYVPYDMYSAFPFFTEMLYAMAMLAEGQKSASVVCVLFLLLSALAAYGLMKECAGGRGARLAAVLFSSTPCFMESSLQSGNDIPLVFYCMLAVLCFFLWRRDRQSYMLLVLAGVFAGVCLSIKYTALTFVPPLLAAGLAGDAIASRERPGPAMAKRAAVLAGAAAAVFLPWCVKNFIATGNPVYPALYPVLGGSDMSPEMYVASRQLAFAASGNFFQAALDNLCRIALPFMPGLGDHGGTLGNAGPGLVLFLPLLPLLRDIPGRIKALCCAAAVLFVAWTLFSGIIRFFYPGMALLVLVSAYVMAAAAAQLPGWMRPLLMLSAALCLALNAGMGLYQANMRTMTYGAAFARESEDAYLRRHMDSNPEALLDGYPADCFINERLGPDACVLLVGDVQHLYVKRRHRYTYQSATTPYVPFKLHRGDYGAVADALKARGITHILYNRTELIRLLEVGVVAWRVEDIPLIEDFLRSSRVEQIYVNLGRGMDVKVYRLL